jgi:hypothetical protein
MIRRMSLASMFNLAAPDLIVLALILLMLAGPIVAVLVILRFTDRSRSAPPPPRSTSEPPTMPGASEEN